MHQTPKVLEVQEHARGLHQHAKFGGAQISVALCGAAKNVEFFVCVSVCLSVCLFVMPVNVQLVRTILPRSTETILILLDTGRFVVVHPCSSISDCCQLATPLNAKVQNMAFFAARGQENKPFELKFGT